MVGREDLRAVPQTWRSYLDVALGLTEAGRQQAARAVRRVVDRGGAAAGQVQAQIQAKAGNLPVDREALLRVVRAEFDRALGRVGLATADEVAALADRVRELERELHGGSGTGQPAPPAAGEAPAAGEPEGGAGRPAPGPVKAAKKAIKKAGVAGKPAEAGKAAARVSGAAKAAAKKTVAKKAGPRAAGRAAPTRPPSGEGGTPTGEGDRP